MCIRAFHEGSKKYRHPGGIPSLGSSGGVRNTRLGPLGTTAGTRTQRGET